MPGLYAIEVEKKFDSRGFFARTFCRKEFKAVGIDFEAVQCNISYNEKRFTLRGMHYQKPPHAEAKIVSCISGAIFDVVIDLRPDSPARYRWESFILDASKKNMLYVPEGFAHGFMTLEECTTVYYQMGNFYEPASACGIRWNDPCFAIEWPSAPHITISERDESYGDFIK